MVTRREIDGLKEKATLMSKGIKLSDGSLWSGLSGTCFDGPKKGRRLIRHAWSWARRRVYEKNRL